MPLFDEYGNVLYRCFICKDSGWVHPVDEAGKPIYSQAKRCRCRGEYQPPLADIQQSQADYQATTRNKGKRRR